MFTPGGFVFSICHNGGILPVMSLLLLACASEEDLLIPLLKSRCGQILGRISYSQYLIQANVLGAMRHHFESSLGRLFIPVYLVTLIILAYIFEATVSFLVTAGSRLQEAVREQWESDSSCSESEQALKEGLELAVSPGENSK